MRFLDLTLGVPQADIALDDRLLDEVEHGAEEVLRVWQPREVFVVLGRSGRADEEVRLDRCEARAVPVLRRSSGGGAVVLAPGCLAFAVVLRIDAGAGRGSTAGAYREVCRRHARALTEQLADGAVKPAGPADLALGGCKVSGNAQRRRRHAILIHGTVLCGMDLTLADELLGRPPRPPGYRHGRGHAEFLTNLPLTPAGAQAALRAAWDAGLVPGPTVY